MIRTSRYFYYCVISIIFQQAILAVSTYYIAKAGESLVASQLNQLKYFIILFFSTALLAYFLGSCVEWLQTKLKNDLWKQYIHKTFVKINRDQRLSSSTNQQKTISWLGTEAPATFTEAGEFIVSIVAIYLNVIFTFIVFGITLGPRVAEVMALSLLVSFLLVTWLKSRIANLAGSMQSNKLTMVLGMNALWNTNLYSNKRAISQATNDFQQRSQQYYKKTESYTVTEQIIACVPIYIALPLVVVCMLAEIDSGRVVIGAFVAVLPRTLQLFGNVHSLSLFNSRYHLIKSKLKNLSNFTDTLDVQHLDTQVNKEKIQIYDFLNNNNVSVDQFMEQLSANEVVQGRYLITGPNGAGKSSLLKLIKSYEQDAILISPHTQLFEYDTNSSTGQSQKAQLRQALAEQASIYLLDEWDANLDQENKHELEQLIDQSAETKLIVEVRHNT